MQNVRKFLDKYGAAIVFGLAFALFIAFCAIPMFDFVNTVVVGEEETEFLQSVSTYGLFSKIILNFNGVLVALNANTTLIIMFALVMIGGAFGAVGLGTKDVFKYRNIFVYLGLASVAIGLLVGIFAQSVTSATLPSTDPLGNEIDLKVDFNAYGSVFVFGALIVMICALIRDILEGTKFSTHDMVEFGVLIALAIILDKLPFMDFTVGAGSVNLSGIPLMILAVRHGPVKGLIASSLIFGFLSCLIDGWGLQTFPFDYLIAFSGYAFAGLAYMLFSKYVFKENTTAHKLLSINIAFVMGGIGILLTRMIGSTMSSMILYQYEIGPALAYNITYVGPSAGFVTAICCALSAPIVMINKLFPAKSEEIADEASENE